MNSGIGPKLPLTIDKKNGFLSVTKFTEEMKQNFKILLLTNAGERVHYPKFGVGLRNYLFENLGLEELDFLIEKKIREQAKIYLPTIDVGKVYIYGNEQIENLLNVTIEFSIKNTNFQDQLTLSFSQ